MTSLQGSHLREKTAFKKRGHNETGAQWGGGTMGRGHNEDSPIVSMHASRVHEFEFKIFVYVKISSLNVDARG